jgi:hypothetical protein
MMRHFEGKDLKDRQFKVTWIKIDVSIDLS